MKKEFFQLSHSYLGSNCNTPFFHCGAPSLSLMSLNPCALGFFHWGLCIILQIDLRALHRREDGCCPLSLPAWVPGFLKSP